MFRSGQERGEPTPEHSLLQRSASLLVDRTRAGRGLPLAFRTREERVERLCPPDVLRRTRICRRGLGGMLPPVPGDERLDL